LVKKVFKYVKCFKKQSGLAFMIYGLQPGPAWFLVTIFLCVHHVYFSLLLFGLIWNYT
jgi:hypothetical protein